MNQRWTPAYDQLFDPENDLADEPACKRWAWLDLCHLAQTKAVVRVIEGVSEPMRRGEVLASERFLAKRWRWNRSKVHRFMAALASEPISKLARVRPTAGGMIYAISKYNAYSLREPPHEPGNEPPKRTTQPDQGLRRQSATSGGSRTTQTNHPTGPQTEPQTNQTLYRRDTTSTNARGPETAPQGVNQKRLSQWLGGGMEEAVASLAGDTPELWCQTFTATWCTETMANGKLRAKVSEERWREVIRDAVSSLVLEEQRYNQRFFRSLVQARVEPDEPKHRKRRADHNPMSVGILP